MSRALGTEPPSVPRLERFIENPIVTAAPGGGFLVVYDSEGADAVGWAYSADGMRARSVSSSCA